MQSTWNNQICINQVDIYIYFKNLLQDSIASHVKNLSVSAFLRLDGSIPGVVCEAAADEVRSFTLQYSSLPLHFFFFIISFYYYTYHSCRFPMRKFSYGISCFSGTPFFLSVAVSVNWWRTISHRVIMKSINVLLSALQTVTQDEWGSPSLILCLRYGQAAVLFFFVFIENFIQHTFSSKKAIYRNSCRTLLLHWGFLKWKRSN